ncbi:hypothetical protein ABE288_20450 [Bacillus salipaludis]|uniref:hypothetical protein n=1 Tax=Bacillus salipaludis TaxID=2547811 RepID=UPI003D192EA5
MNNNQINNKEISCYKGLQIYIDGEDIDTPKEVLVLLRENSCSVNIHSCDDKEIFSVECETSELANLLVFGNKLAKVFNISLCVMFDEDDWMINLNRP